MQRSIVISLILLIVGNLFSAFYDVSIKWLPDDANAATFLLVRQISSVFMLLPVWLYAQRPMTTHISVHLWRANIGSVGALFLIIGLMALPLATVSSLFYSAPLMIMLMGYGFLKERITTGQVICALLGFVGILIILRPSEMNWFGLAVLFSAFTFAVNQLTLKKVPNTEHPVLTLMLYNLLGIPATLLIAAFQGLQGMSWELLAIALLSNAFLLIYHWFCVLAYRKAQASDIAIAEYTGLLFIVFLGWLLFDEWLDSLSWFGAALIVLPSLFLPWIGRLMAQQPKVIEGLRAEPLAIEGGEPKR
ncbi:DMT family transporter [Shewanella sp. CG12_big_fil_rev_8_21_14_0_65_47_15]|uniref:DMT family transporter n=1 Tax=Shewanella sp. CG12_big_fil_rev_8_21_14_0_65_47_15 TaxID=1975537 RepID=UPI000CB553E7|nr:DMT family transporter [Shewanella sp. CG12_big_fil_rev_8_21_14_0_65_47_15]PIW62304.1 MAG: EamA/RhaT family transporter [Shewanella sp. CG12_big_fil_rev_8_21_14_0_65_47_15]